MKCREFAELQKVKQQVTQRHAELQQEFSILLTMKKGTQQHIKRNVLMAVDYLKIFFVLIVILPPIMEGTGGG